jgi:hypothetical protein
MTDQRIKIVELLIQRTGKGALPWETGFDDGTFKVDIGSNTVVIGEKKVSGRATIVVRLYNELGTLVESFNDEDLKDPEDSQHDYYWFSAMSDLLEAARRKALGADEVIQSIIDGLTEV